MASLCGANNVENGRATRDRMLSAKQPTPHVPNPNPGDQLGAGEAASLGRLEVLRAAAPGWVRLEPQTRLQGVLRVRADADLNQLPGLA